MSKTTARNYTSAIKNLPTALFSKSVLITAQPFVAYHFTSSLINPDRQRRQKKLTYKLNKLTALQPSTPGFQTPHGESRSPLACTRHKMMNLKSIRHLQIDRLVVPRRGVVRSRLRSLLYTLIVHQSGSLFFGGNLGEHNVEVEAFREVEVGAM